MSRQLGSIRIIIILLVGGLIAGSLYWLRPKPQIRPPVEVKPPPVSVIHIQPQPQQIHVATQGTVMPSRDINLLAEVSGRVMEVSKDFSNGGFVEKDDVLIRLDARDYQYRLVESEAQVAVAERELALEKGQARQAKREWRDLGSKEANALSLREPQVNAANAQLAAAQAQRNQALLNLERTRIRAPFHGRLQETYVDVGQYVTAGTVIARLYDSTLAEVRLPLNDKQIALIGLPLGKSVNDEFPIAVILSAQVAGTEYEWPAKLTRTEASIDSSTRFYFAIAEIAEPFDRDRYASPLVMGLFVEANIVGLQFDDVVTAPEKSIVNEQYVYVVDEQQRVQKRDISVLGKQQNVAWIRGEFNENETLVVSDPKVLQANMLVTPTIVDNLFIAK
jgi:RND family efflux transporter MFP subunit